MSAEEPDSQDSDANLDITILTIAPFNIHDPAKYYL